MDEVEGSDAVAGRSLVKGHREPVIMNGREASQGREEELVHRLVAAIYAGDGDGARGSGGSDGAGAGDANGISHGNGLLNYSELILYKDVLYDVPLAELIRPRNLQEYIGQKHLLDRSVGHIFNFIRLGYLPSMILAGPPGVGKTSLAYNLARQVGYVMVEMSALECSVADIRDLVEVIRKVNRNRGTKGDNRLKIAVFIDEIHRLTKTHQDFLLPFVESGLFSLIGATNMDPLKRIRKAVLSRCQLFKLLPLTNAECHCVLRKAILYENIRRKLSRRLKFLSYDDECLDTVMRISKGDARAAINMIELVSGSFTLAAFKATPAFKEPFQLNLKHLESMIISLKVNQSGLSKQENIFLVKRLYRLMFSAKDACKIGDFPHEKTSRSNTNATSKPTLNRNCLNSSNNGSSEQLVTFGAKNDSSYFVNIKVNRNTLATLKRPPLNLSWRTRNNIHSKFSASSVSLDKEFTSRLEKMVSPSKWNQYLEQMEVSDDSDVEAGSIYSRDDEESSALALDWRNLLEIDYYVLAAFNTIIKLLHSGESITYISKQILLFTVTYIEPDEMHLLDIMALLKSLQQSSSDYLLVFYNCVENLIKSRKITVRSRFTDPIVKLKAMKCFFESEGGELKDSDISTNLKNDSTFLQEFPIHYDSDLVESLLSATPCQRPLEDSRFEIEQVDDAKVIQSLCGL